MLTKSSNSTAHHLSKTPLLQSTTPNYALVMALKELRKPVFEVVQKLIQISNKKSLNHKLSY